MHTYLRRVRRSLTAFVAMALLSAPFSANSVITIPFEVDGDWIFDIFSGLPSVPDGAIAVESPPSAPGITLQFDDITGSGSFDVEIVDLDLIGPDGLTVELFSGGSPPPGTITVDATAGTFDMFFDIGYDLMIEGSSTAGFVKASPETIDTGFANATGEGTITIFLDGTVLSTHSRSTLIVSGQDAGGLNLDQFTVENENQPPLANPGGPYEFSAEKQSVQLDGSGVEVVDFAWAIDEKAVGFGPTPPPLTLESGLTGLTNTTDTSEVELFVLDDEGTPNLNLKGAVPENEDNVASVSYENTPPSFVGPFEAKPTLKETTSGGHFFEYRIEGTALDPDLAVGIVVFETVSIFSGAPDDNFSSSPHEAEYQFFILEDSLDVPENGALTVSIRDQAGTREEKVITVFSGFFDNFTTFVSAQKSGSPAAVVQLVDTPAALFDFQFDYLFETFTGELVVSLDGGPIITVPAPVALDSLFTTLLVPVNDPSLLNLNDILLAFTVDGPAGSQVLLDNIIFSRTS